MRLWRRWVFATVALVVAVVAVDLFVTRTQPFSRGSRMTLSSGCHPSIRSPLDVSNPEGFGDPLAKTLAPPAPIRGLMCRYFSYYTQGTHLESLFRSVPLTGAQAGQLVIDLERLRPQPNGADCGRVQPFLNLDDVLILAYRDRHDVDVLSSDLGCVGIFNGHLRLVEPLIGSDTLFSDWALTVGPVVGPTCGPNMRGPGEKPIPCSSGVSPIAPLTRAKVPSVVGLNIKEAEDRLMAAGFSGLPCAAPNSKAPKGQIVSQSPAAGSVVYAGIEVQICGVGI